MNLTTLMKIGDNITENSPLGDRATVGLQVVLIGMGVVFGVLLLLMAILQLFKLFSIQKTVEKQNESPVAAAPAPVQAVAPTPVSVTSVPASEEEKIVAIATAAIAAARGESECAFNVISIKKIVK